MGYDAARDIAGRSDPIIDRRIDPKKETIAHLTSLSSLPFWTEHVRLGLDGEAIGVNSASIDSGRIGLITPYLTD